MPLTPGEIALVSTAAGASAAILGGYISSVHAAKREREARREERVAIARARRAEFETETIVRAQEALIDLVRLTGEIYQRRRSEQVNSGSWPTTEAVGRRDDYTDRRFEAVKYVDRLMGERIRDLGTTVIQRCDVMTSLDSPTADRYVDVSGAMGVASLALTNRLEEIYSDATALAAPSGT